MTHLQKDQMLHQLKSTLALYKNEFFPTTEQEMYEALKDVVDKWDELTSPDDDAHKSALAYVVNFKNDSVNRRVAYFRTKSQAINFVKTQYKDYTPYVSPFAPEEETDSWENLSKHSIVFITTEWTD